MRLLLFCLLCLPNLLSGQLLTPPSSAPAELRTQIGLTQFVLNYHRPSVKGRSIFGDLIPYGEVWRTGANEATLLRFDQAIVIEDQEVAAGTYAIYTIPSEKDWTFILSSDTTLWGARGYDASKDVLRQAISPKTLPERIETMEFRWLNLTHTRGDLVLEWENIRLAIPIALRTHEQVDASIAAELNETAQAGDYYRAARYYLDNKLDLSNAKGWMDRWLELNGEQFGIMRYQAIIEKQLGNDADAERIMRRSLELAEARPNPHYVSMNTRTLEEWRREALSMTGEEVIRHSIAYHDPQNKWLTEAHRLKLYESRPDGGYRISELTIDEGQQKFVLDQQRGRNHIHRNADAFGCKLLLNGQARFSEEEAKQFRLSCEGTELYRNYYAYLWGLPMKLQDEGTRVQSATALVDFFGQRLIEVKVNYDPSVGEDIWYFYFHPETYALSGYRFYHDEAANDGEYILIDSEAQVGDLLLPANRHWYTHGDARYLGSDEIIK